MARYASAQSGAFPGNAIRDMARKLTFGRSTHGHRFDERETGVDERVHHDADDTRQQQRQHAMMKPKRSVRANGTASGVGYSRLNG